MELTVFFIVTLSITYSNHFSNGFYFDDFHSIVNNTWIQDIKNIPTFFTKRETISIYPKNQGGLRPVVTSLNAIDYWLAGNKLNTKFFHGHMFFNYLILCVFMYFVLLRIFNLTVKNNWNRYVALLCTAFYAHHTANAETLNYIISRSDLFSTACLVTSLAMFQFPKTRKFFLYIIPFLVALLTKEVSFMFPFVLLLYVWMFEKELSIPDTFAFFMIPIPILYILSRSKRGFSIPYFLKPGSAKKLLRGALSALPVFLILGLIIIFLTTFYQTDSGYVSRTAGWTLEERMDYFMTQSYVLTRYTGNLLLPFNLSADPDIKIIHDWTDLRVVFGLLHLLFFAGVCIVTSFSKRTRPISFGLAWFYIFLAPTSSFNKMFQVSNDHRTFIAYIGLVMALGWAIALLAYNLREKIKNQNWLVYPSLATFLIVMLFYSYGTYQRNKVWSTSESLWHDVTIKSPNNPRGLMNYGLALMAKGEYEDAEDYYDRAMAIWPRWIYLHINMGILKDAQKQPKEAEKYFKNALKFGDDNPDSYYFYARYHFTNKRYNEAIKLLNKGKAMSPYHAKINELLPAVLAMTDEGKASNIEILKGVVEKNPTYSSMMTLGLAYYQNGQYTACIETSQKALELNPESSSAHNNICAAYCARKEWDKAIIHCNKALELNPDFQRAKNNLNWALGELEKLQ